MGPPSSTNFRGFNPRFGFPPDNFDTIAPWAPLSSVQDTRYRIITYRTPSQLTQLGAPPSRTPSHRVVTTGPPPYGPPPLVSAWPTAGLAGVDESLIDPMLLEPPRASAATDLNVAINNRRMTVQPITSGRVTQLDDAAEQPNAVSRVTRDGQQTRDLDPLPDSAETLIVRTIIQIASNAGSHFRSGMSKSLLPFPSKLTTCILNIK